MGDSTAGVGAGAHGWDRGIALKIENDGSSEAQVTEFALMEFDEFDYGR